jgi:hypothetical protein
VNGLGWPTAVGEYAPDGLGWPLADDGLDALGSTTGQADSAGRPGAWSGQAPRSLNAGTPWREAIHFPRRPTMPTEAGASCADSAGSAADPGEVPRESTGQDHGAGEAGITPGSVRTGATTMTTAGPSRILTRDHVRACATEVQVVRSLADADLPAVPCQPLDPDRGATAHATAGGQLPRMPGPGGAGNGGPVGRLELVGAPASGESVAEMSADRPDGSGAQSLLVDLSSADLRSPPGTRGAPGLGWPTARAGTEPEPGVAGSGGGWLGRVDARGRPAMSGSDHERALPVVASGHGWPSASSAGQRRLRAPRAREAARVGKSRSETAPSHRMRHSWCSEWLAVSLVLRAAPTSTRSSRARSHRSWRPARSLPLSMEVG